MKLINFELSKTGTVLETKTQNGKARVGSAWPVSSWDVTLKTQEAAKAL